MALVPLLGALKFCPVLGEFGLNLRKCGSGSLSPQWGSYPLVPLIDSCWWERGVCASELVPAKLVWFLRPSLAGGLKVRTVPSTSHVSRKLGPLSPHCPGVTLRRGTLPGWFSGSLPICPSSLTMSSSPGRVQHVLLQYLVRGQ